MYVYILYIYVYVYYIYVYVYIYVKIVDICRCLSIILALIWWYSKWQTSNISIRRYGYHNESQRGNVGHWWSVQKVAKSNLRTWVTWPNRSMKGCWAAALLGCSDFSWGGSKCLVGWKVQQEHCSQVTPGCHHCNISPELVRSWGIQTDTIHAQNKCET